MELAGHFTFPSCPVTGSTLWLQFQVVLFYDDFILFIIYFKVYLEEINMSNVLYRLVIFLKGNNKLELNKKGFDYLANNEKGEQQKKEQAEVQDEGINQEKAKTPEKTNSCEHPDQRAESKENQEKGGIKQQLK